MNFCLRAAHRKRERRIQWFNSHTRISVGHDFAHQPACYFDEAKITAILRHPAPALTDKKR
jgi:hypothetical protein